MMRPIDAVMILGPTACGKTSVALNLAQWIPSEIISMDSALVYRGMDIGTAKPTKEEMNGIPHHLIDILDPTETYSAASFATDTEILIEEIRSRNKLPLIVGGTMLYAKALMDGLSNIPATTVEVRNQIKAELEVCGIQKLYERLASRDPVTASRLKSTDVQRISRALEVLEMTGLPLTSFYGKEQGTKFKILRIGLMPSDRKVLHEMIAKRFDLMLEMGFIDEVTKLKENPNLEKDCTSMRCVGYRQAWEYLEGNVDFQSFREASIAATRQLAKRQMTWMRSMDQLILIDSLKEDCNVLIKKIVEEHM